MFVAIEVMNGSILKRLDAAKLSSGTRLELKIGLKEELDSARVVTAITDDWRENNQ